MTSHLDEGLMQRLRNFRQCLKLVCARVEYQLKQKISGAKYFGKQRSEKSIIYITQYKSSAHFNKYCICDVHNKKV